MSPAAFALCEVARVPVHVWLWCSFTGASPSLAMLWRALALAALSSVVHIASHVGLRLAYQRAVRRRQWAVAAGAGAEPGAAGPSATRYLIAKVGKAG